MDRFQEIFDNDGNLRYLISVDRNQLSFFYWAGESFPHIFAMSKEND